MGDNQDFFADAPLFRPDPADEASSDVEPEVVDISSSSSRSPSPQPARRSQCPTTRATKRPHDSAFGSTTKSHPIERQEARAPTPQSSNYAGQASKSGPDPTPESGRQQQQREPDMQQLGQPATSARTEGEHALLALPWNRLYLGNFVVQAWSTTSGKGWLSVGDAVKLVGETQEPPTAPKPKPKAKQTTLSFGTASNNNNNNNNNIRARQALAQSKKRDQNILIRFINPQGFEIGRILKEHSVWLAKLLRNRLVDLRGRVIDCPATLTMGSDVVLSIDVYLHRDVFLDAGQYTLTE